MAGRKNIYQQYGQMMPEVQGKDIFARNDAYLNHEITVYCKSCGKEIAMPSSDGPGAYGMDIYQMEVQHQIHADCARELDRRGIKY